MFIKKSQTTFPGIKADFFKILHTGGTSGRGMTCASTGRRGHGGLRLLLSGSGGSGRGFRFEDRKRVLQFEVCPRL